MNKKLREQVRLKYGGLCAYSGTPLKDNWQIDHAHSLRNYVIRPDWGTFDVNGLDNLMPAQRIINHYKREKNVDMFRAYLMTLHERLLKLPVSPRVKKSIRHKEYLLEVAELFGITTDKPFCGVFYFEQLN